METQATTAPAGNSSTFAHPRIVRRLAVLSIVFCTAACVAALLLPLLAPSEDHRLLAVACLAVFGGVLYYSVAAVRSSRDTIVVAEDGLWCHSPKKPSLFLRWNEIAGVQAQNVMQRLVVTDFSGTRRIILEYHLQNFGELRRTVLERATRRTVDRRNHPDARSPS